MFEFLSWRVWDKQAFLVFYFTLITLWPLAHLCYPPKIKPHPGHIRNARSSLAHLLNGGQWSLAGIVTKNTVYSGFSLENSKELFRFTTIERLAPSDRFPPIGYTVMVTFILFILFYPLFKFSATWSCVSLPRPTTSSSWKLLIFV